MDRKRRTTSSRLSAAVHAATTGQQTASSGYTAPQDNPSYSYTPPQDTASYTPPQDTTNYADYASNYGGGYSGGGGYGYAPVVLDIAGKGINIGQLTSSNTFEDMTGDGYKNRTAWAGVGNGVLFVDTTGAGQLTQANQIIFTKWDPGAKSDMQALLDVFTLCERLGTLAGKRILVVGDIQHSRVARSNCGNSSSSSGTRPSSRSSISDRLSAAPISCTSI